MIQHLYIYLAEQLLQGSSGGGCRFCWAVIVDQAQCGGGLQSAPQSISFLAVDGIRHLFAGQTALQGWVNPG